MPILFWGALFGLIASIFIRAASAVVTVIKVVVPIIVRVFVTLGKVIARVGQAFADFARTIANAAKALVDGVIKPALNAIGRFFQKVEQFFSRITAPIRDILARINKALDWVWTKILAPVLDVIGKIRAILRLLAELGLEWAEKLDRILQQIESRIFETFREIRTWVNTFELWLDLLLHPGGWIRSFPFMLTVFKWSGNIMGILVNLGLDPLTPARNELTRQDHPQRPPSDTLARFRAGYYRDHWAVQSAIARLRSRGTGGR